MKNRERLLDSPVTQSSPDVPAFIAVRHGQDDESYIDGLFDNGLVPERADEIVHLADEIASFFKEAGNYTHVRLLHSSKLRAYQTSAVIEQYLSGVNISASRRRVDELRELYQGEMVLTDDQTLQERAAILERAWQAYGVAVEACDFTYRFGDPDIQENGMARYPGLENVFAGYGENQYEFTKRIYEFVRDTMQYDFEGALPVIVAHRATVTKIQRIMGACSILGESIEPGDLPTAERSTPRTKVGHAQGVILPLRRQVVARNVIEREIGLLHATYREGV